MSLFKAKSLFDDVVGPSFCFQIDGAYVKPQDPYT